MGNPSTKTRIDLTRHANALSVVSDNENGKLDEQENANVKSMFVPSTSCVISTLGRVGEALQTSTYWRRLHTRFRRTGFHLKMQTWRSHPASLHLAARKLDVPINHYLMVSDTPMNVSAARRAGACSAAVLCGFGQRNELERAGAHVTLERPAELTDVAFVTTSLQKPLEPKMEKR